MIGTFPPEGRERPPLRMRDYVRKSVAKGNYGVADFVCLQMNLGKRMFQYVIWMNTIEEGRFEDTNKMFEKPDGSTYINAVINADEWWTEEKCEEWARLLAVDIKDHEFPTQATQQHKC